LTQFDVARRSGVDRSKLSLAENGHVDLSGEEIIAIRKVLLERIESNAVQLKGVLSENAAIAV